MFKKVILALTVVVALGMPTTVFGKGHFNGEYRQGEILSFGSSLTTKEELALRDYFGVSQDMDAIYVDNATAIEQLGLAPDALDNYTGGWYSSAYVKLTADNGIKVTSNNVSLVTNEMFTNALITSGILNCEVLVSAPFMVTGESALAGILAGAEEIMGESLSEENKQVAKEEIDTTLDVADDILNNEDNDIDNQGDSSNIASGIMNDIKEQVIKDSPNSTQIQEIIINVTNNYGVELSPETQARVLSLMEDVNDLDIEYKDIKDTMQNIGDSIADSLKEAGIKLKESGFFDRLFDLVSELFQNLVDWVKGLFASANETTDETLDQTTLPENNETPATDESDSAVDGADQDAAVNGDDQVSSDESTEAQTDETTEDDVVEGQETDTEQTEDSTAENQDGGSESTEGTDTEGTEVQN